MPFSVFESFGHSFIFYMNFYYLSNIKFIMACDTLEILTLLLPQNSIAIPQFFRKNGKIDIHSKNGKKGRKIPSKSLVIQFYLFRCMK